MRECPDCGVVLDDNDWPEGETCPVCNPYEEDDNELVDGIYGEVFEPDSEDLELLGGIFGAAIDDPIDTEYGFPCGRGA